MSQLTNEVLRTLDEIARLTASLNPVDTSTQPTFTWQNAEYPAIAAVEVEENLFGAGGLGPINTLKLTVRRSVFGDARPHAEDFVIYNVHRYVIKIVQPSPDGTAFIFTCMDPDRGAAFVHEREV